MFLPFFIAILLGFASPTDTNSTCTNNNDSTVNVSSDSPPSDDTGGETGHTPIRN